MSKKELLLDFLSEEYIKNCIEETIIMLENKYFPHKLDTKEIKTKEFSKSRFHINDNVNRIRDFYRKSILNSVRGNDIDSNIFLEILNNTIEEKSSISGTYEMYLEDFLSAYFSHNYGILLSGGDNTEYYIQIIVHLRICNDLLRKLEHEQIWIDKHIDIDKIIDFKQVYSRFQLYQNENQNLLKNWMSFLKYLIRKKHFKSAIAGVKIKADITYCRFLSELIFSNPTRLDSTYKKYYKDIKDSTSKGIDSILDA